MKTISFTENEIEYVKELYNQELERLQSRTNIVKALLARLDSFEKAKAPAAKVTKPEKTKGKDELENVVESEINAILKAPKAKKQKAILKPKEKAATSKKQEAKKVKAAKPKAEAKQPKQPKAPKQPKEAKGKPGRKKSSDSKRSVWATTVLDIIKNYGKLTPTSVIVDEAMKLNGIPSSDIKNARSMVGNSMTTLKKEYRIKSAPNPGKKGELYGLAEWFDANGKLTDKTRQK